MTATILRPVERLLRHPLSHGGEAGSDGHAGFVGEPIGSGSGNDLLGWCTTGATGTVTFLDGTTILGTGTITGGAATFTTSALAIGTHSITASYSGDSAYNAAVSAVLTQVVGKIPTVTTITVSAPAQLLHTGVTFTANVTAPSPNATGTVTFMDGTTVLGTATLSGNGGVIVSLTTNANAAFATTSLVTGPHQIVAVYSGDGTFAPSTSAPAPNMVEDFTNANTGPASQNVRSRARAPPITSL